MPSATPTPLTPMTAATVATTRRLFCCVDAERIEEEGWLSFARLAGVDHRTLHGLRMDGMDINRARETERWSDREREGMRCGISSVRTDGQTDSGRRVAIASAAPCPRK